jgi:DMSO/TMAO reductase YedYZ molybdopterin-dependent catalytic subunit
LKKSWDHSLQRVNNLHLIRFIEHGEDERMSKQSRRDVLKGGLVLAGWTVFGLPELTLPALAQGESLVPFTDIPANTAFGGTAETRRYDIRKIDGPFTPKDEFFTTQHYGHPNVDVAAYRLKVTGLVDRPKSLSLDELKKMGNQELIAGFECSGNQGATQALCSNGRWTGVPLKAVLDSAGVKSSAREFVFFGADHGEEEVEFRNQKYKLDQNFGRSLPRERALSGEPFLAWAMNGEPLTKHQGYPLRLIVPGWYGVANVKWLQHIHIQEEAFLGKYQARWYRTVRGEMIDDQMVWNETAVTHMQLKSFVARVTAQGGRHSVLVVVLNDGTPVRSVEVSIDGGPWQPAVAEKSTNAKYGWKHYTYTWNGATPGEHTLISRVTDNTGKVQPTAKDLENKRSFLENNSQIQRKVMIS